MAPRKVDNIVKAKETIEGNGALVRRSLGPAEVDYFDPFLMLDEAFIAPPMGFPDHPHKGFETVTYCLKGQITHEDFFGHTGILNDGDIEWLTAGKGVKHCAWPTAETHALQLWVNLPAEFKYVEPTRQELKDADVPRVSADGVTVKIIAGEAMGVKAQTKTRTPTLYMDITMEKGATYTQAVPEGWASFCYVVTGSAYFGSGADAKLGEAHHKLILTNGDSIEIKHTGDEPVRYTIVAGKPCNEPICKKGPFVMNTQEEIDETLHDYQNHLNAFANGKGWTSAYNKVDTQYT